MSWMDKGASKRPDVSCPVHTVCLVVVEWECMLNAQT